MKRKALIGVVTALALTACGSGTANTSTGPEAGGDSNYKIGIATIVSHPSLDAVVAGFKEGMSEAGVSVEFDEQNAQGDQATLTNIANTFATGDYDGFLAVATPTAQALSTAISQTPITFAAVTDPVAAGLVTSWETPDGNVTGVSDLNPMQDQLALIQEIVPDAKTIGIVYSSGEVNSEVQVAEAQKAAAATGVEILTATVTNSS